MGMYTELFLQVKLKKTTPPEIIQTLRYMIGEDVDRPPAPFEAERWDYMLQCSSFYHYPFAHSFLDGRIGNLYLFVRCDFKNYTGELKQFLDWIAPHVEYLPGHYEGHHFYEESTNPTRIYFNGTTWQEEQVAIETLNG